MKKVSRLRQLINVQFDGNQAAFARAIGRSPSQVNQWLLGRRGVGGGASRHIEKTLKLPTGWMDSESTGEDLKLNLQTSQPWPMDLVSQEKYELLTHVEKCRVQVHMADEIEEILKSRQVSKKV